MAARRVGKLTSSVGAKQRGVMRGVKRSVCNRCGGGYWDRSLPRPAVTAPAFLCKCPKGWVGVETNLGVLADSGPTRFLPRLWWNFTQWIAGGIDKLTKRAA